MSDLQPTACSLRSIRAWLATTALLCACAPAPSIHTLEFLAMGTTVSISVADPAPAGLSHTLADVESQMQRLGREWYPWTPDGSGELARLNTAIANGQTTEVSPELAALLSEAATLAAASGGRFDPAIGPLVELWGFTTGSRDAAAPLPDSGALAAWAMSHPTYADLTIQGTLVGSRNARLKLDLGAIAKGRAVDLAARQLKARGVSQALVTAGGNVRALGEAPGRQWRVAIRDPRGPGILGWIDLQDDESIDTSGDYEHFEMVAGRRIHHLLDPRSGTPADHTASVTVIASTGTLADASATALFIAGSRDWQHVARALGIQAVLRIDSDGRIQATREMADRLHWEVSPDARTQIAVVDL